MIEEKKPKTITCPECFEELPEDDIRARVIHMERHPDAIVRHLEDLGLYKAADRVLQERKQAAGRKIK